MALVSCKNEPKTSTTETPQAVSQTESPSNIDITENISLPNDLPVPNTCEFITKEWILDNFQVDDAFNLDIKSGKATDDNSNSSSCFYRWAWGDLPNAGFLMQILTNPVEDDYPDWVSEYVDIKRQAGSGTLTAGENYAFKDFPGFGDKGCYNSQLKQYYWSQGNDYLFQLALNMEVDDATQLSNAKKLAAKFMEGFNAQMN